tara:strand:+ start:139 stop:342 length:204 start_codon:yes stop_codon:yes gene_type:complete
MGMECFEQKDMSNELLMQTLDNMGKNITLSSKLWKNGNYSKNNINQLKKWIKTINKIEKQMSFNLGL